MGSHVKGTCSVTALAVNGAFAKGATSLNLDAAALYRVLGWHVLPILHSSVTLDGTSLAVEGMKINKLRVFYRTAYDEEFAFRLDGVAYDLTGSTPLLQLRARDGSLVAQFAVGSGLAISGHLLTWTISSLVTSGYEPGSYLFDLEISISGDKRTYVSGAFRVVKDITR